MRHDAGWHIEIQGAQTSTFDVRAGANGCQPTPTTASKRPTTSFTPGCVGATYRGPGCGGVATGGRPPAA